MTTANGRGSVTSPKPEAPQFTHDAEGSNTFGWSQIGVHDLVPKLGYREYWYPAIEARKVGRKAYWLFGTRKPTRVKMLGEDIVLFQGKDGPEGHAGGWRQRLKLLLARLFRSHLGSLFNFIRSFQSRCHTSRRSPSVSILPTF